LFRTESGKEMRAKRMSAFSWLSSNPINCGFSF